MRLVITSVGSFAVADDEVIALRAEDASGSFGILPGHADFLTALEVGVVSWRRREGRERHCAVRRGVLRVRAGRVIEIATREAVMDEDLGRLESTVLQEFRARDEVERSTRTESHALELKALREIIRYLQPERAGRLWTPR